MCCWSCPASKLRNGYAYGSGLIGAGHVGLVAGSAYGLLVVLFMVLRPPILRLAVALVFVAPPAVAGYSLVHGITAGGYVVRDLARDLLLDQRQPNRHFRAVTVGC